MEGNREMASLGKIVRIGFTFGTKVVPKVLKFFGFDADKTIKNIAGYGNMWTGLLIGAGVALIAVSAVLTATTGGALLAPGVMGGIIMDGTIGIMAGAVGWGLFRAGEHELGFSLLEKIKDYVRRIHVDVKVAPPPQQTPPANADRTASVISLAKRPAPHFRNAAGLRPVPVRVVHRPRAVLAARPTF